MCCLFFLREKRQHINKIPMKSEEKAGTVMRQSQDNPMNILFMRFLVYWFFPGLMNEKHTFQGRKKNPNPNCFGRISSGGGGVGPRVLNFHP